MTEHVTGTLGSARPRCPARTPHGARCRRKEGHAADHRHWSRIVSQAWPQEEA